MNIDFQTYYFIQLSVDLIISILYRLGWIGYFNEKKLEIDMDGLTLFLILLPLPIATLASSLTMLANKKDVGNIKSIKKGWSILFNKNKEKTGTPQKIVKLKDYKWLPDEVYSLLKQVAPKKFETGNKFSIPWKYGLNMYISFNKWVTTNITIEFSGDYSYSYTMLCKGINTNQEKYEELIAQIEDELRILKLDFNPFLSENSKIQQR